MATDLDVFTLCFVVQDVSHVACKDFLTAGTSVNTDHSDTDRPRRVADCHLQICIIGLQE